MEILFSGTVGIHSDGQPDGGSVGEVEHFGLDESALAKLPTGELYTIDVQTLTITNSAPIECSGLAVTPDGEYLYCTTASEVDILSTSSLSIVGTIPQVDGFLLGQPIVIAK